jgi:DNA polymerase-1
MLRLYQNEMALTHVCCEIERVGVKINRSFVQDGLAYEHEQIKKAKKDFETDTGRAFVNSSKLFAEIFTLRGEKYPLTEKGNPSFAKDFLEDLDTPTAQLINRIRFHEKRASTYWSSFLYFADSDNVLHPRLNQAGTVTGRFSSSNPNMQNMPKEDDDEDRDKKFLVRRAFTPRRDHCFYSLDYNQMEYRLMLDTVGEQALIDAVNGGEDVHSATSRILGISRTHAKTVNFALLYGTGNTKLARMLGVTEAEARDIKKLYFQSSRKSNTTSGDCRKRRKKRLHLQLVWPRLLVR